MADFCRSHGFPRAGVDPITDGTIALDLLMSMAGFPLAPQVVVVVLDERRVGRSGMVVHGATSPDSAVVVAETLKEAIPEPGVPAASAVLMASIRPRGYLDDRDGDRWLEMCDLLEQRSAQLLEWFVVTDHEVWCPRDLLGVPSRWRRRAA